jgi:hypothetical protein
VRGTPDLEQAIEAVTSRPTAAGFLTRLETLTAAVAAEPDRPLRDLHWTAGLF